MIPLYELTDTESEIIATSFQFLFNGKMLGTFQNKGEKTIIETYLSNVDIFSAHAIKN